MDIEFKIVNKSKKGATIQCADGARYVISWHVFKKCFTEPSENNIVTISDVVAKWWSLLAINYLTIKAHTLDPFLVHKHILAVNAVLDLSSDEDVMMFLNQAAQLYSNSTLKKRRQLNIDSEKKGRKLIVLQTLVHSACLIRIWPPFKN